MTRQCIKIRFDLDFCKIMTTRWTGGHYLGSYRKISFDAYIFSALIGMVESRVVVSGTVG